MLHVEAAVVYAHQPYPMLPSFLATTFVNNQLVMCGACMHTYKVAAAINLKHSHGGQVHKV
jgi:hypothetical protein